MSALNNIQEDEGTMLDNTGIILTSEIYRGNTHSHMNQNFLVAGGCGGALKMNQFINYDGEKPHNDLLVSMLQAYGIETDTFGDEESCTGPLTELMA
jgi:hypothetical protein